MSIYKYACDTHYIIADMLAEHIEKEKLVELIRHYLTDGRMLKIETGRSLIQGLLNAWERKEKRIDSKSFFDPSKNLRIR